MNECEKYREMMSAMLDGELDAGESERLIAHLSSCAECRELYELLSSVSGPEVWELPEVPEGLHGHIMSGVRAAAAEKKKRARVVRLRPVAMAAACLVLIVGVIIGVPRVFRMGSSGSSGGRPESMFNTAAAASSNSAPAAHDNNAAMDTAAPAEAPEINGAPAQDVPADSDGYGYTGGSANSVTSEGVTLEVAPVPEPDAPEEREESEAAELDIDIDSSVVTVERRGESVSEKLNRYDTLLWLRAIIEQTGGGFDAAKLEIFRRGGADYEVYFYHDGGKLMGSLSEDLENGIELETLADFAQFEEMAGGAN